jgi:hypothetical protein
LCLGEREREERKEREKKRGGGGGERKNVNNFGFRTVFLVPRMHFFC